MTRPLWQLSACEMREGLRARRFLATEIIESVAGRISTRNGHVNAIVDDYTDQALREAEAADAASANGHAIGPLHGMTLLRRGLILYLSGASKPKAVLERRDSMLL